MGQLLPAVADRLDAPEPLRIHRHPAALLRQLAEVRRDGGKFRLPAAALQYRLLDQGLVNESSFSYEYFEGNGYASVMFSGESKDPQAVAQAILEEVERFQREGIPAEAFERSKRALYGELVAALNSTGSIANGLVNMHLKGRELFTYIDSLASLRLEDGEERLRKVFQRERSVLSVILPH